MPSPTKPEEYKNVSLLEFANILKWVVELISSINPRQATTYIITSILHNLQWILNTYIITKIIDNIMTLAQREGARIQDIYPQMGILIAFNLVTTVNRFFRLYAERTLTLSSRPSIRKALYTKLYSLGIQTLEEPEINNKIHRASNELYSIVPFFRQTVELITFAIGTLVVLFLLLKAAPLAVLIITAISLPSFIHDKKYRRIAWKFGFDNTENQRKASSNAWDLIETSMLQEIFINKAFEFLSYKFTSFYDWYTQKNIELRKKWFTGMYSLGFITDLGIYSGYLIIFAKLITQAITIGTTFFQYRLINMLRDNLDRATSDLNTLFEQAITLKDTYTLFQTTSAFEKGTIKMPKLDKGPAIKVHGLSFKYPNSEKLVLKDINLDIKPGEKVAIVGHNGAGKTTLVKLICKMYMPTEGKIIINSQDLKELHIESWYDNLGVLFQDFNTYPQLTLRENVAVGKPIYYHNDEDIVDALERADALSLVDEFEGGLDQILSEKYKGGVRPSTGQWQKIAIARFFYRNTPFVIFDEPTAAIDPVSEYNIFNKIYSFFEDKTVILISHRFSTVRNADRIVVLDKGKIIEEGGHEELIKKAGKYAEAFMLQAEGYSMQ